MNEGVVTLDTYYNQNADIKAEIRKCMQRNLIDDALSLTEQLDDSDPDFYFFSSLGICRKRLDPTGPRVCPHRHADGQCQRRIRGPLEPPRQPSGSRL